MNKIETREDLLRLMHKINACNPATLYVESFREGYPAIDIINRLSCNVRCGGYIHVDWLIWLLGGQGRLNRFGRACILRTANVLDPATRLDAFARDLRTYTGSWSEILILANQASYSPKTGNTTSERAAQLAGLKRIARNFFRGLPAEK